MPDDLKQHILDIYGRNDIVLALSTGTPSPFRKITAMIMDPNGEVLGYSKIGETPLAIGRIKNEAKMLKVIGNRLLVIGKENTNSGSEVMGHGMKDYGVRIRIPQLLYEGEIDNAYLMIQSPPPFEGKNGDKYLNESYANILKVLIDNTKVEKKLTDTNFYKNLKDGIASYPLSYKDLLIKGLEYIEDSIGNKEIIFALSHGDFAPWNMLWSKDKKEVFLYDWESATSEAPAGIDIIHFLFQTGFLLKRLRGEKLFKYIIQSPFFSVFSLHPDILILFYSLYIAITEDQPQQLNAAAVERRKLIKMVIGDG